jgi:hypothetical protein
MPSDLGQAFTFGPDLREERAAVLESRADPGPGIPWEQVRADAGL